MRFCSCSCESESGGRCGRWQHRAGRLCPENRVAARAWLENASTATPHTGAHIAVVHRIIAATRYTWELIIPSGRGHACKINSLARRWCCGGGHDGGGCNSGYDRSFRFESTGTAALYIAASWTRACYPLTTINAIILEVIRANTPVIFCAFANGIGSGNSCSVAVR